MPEHWDVIVVGGGGSGVPLAARLSEDPGTSVLLLEAGPAPVGPGGYPPELLDAGTVQGAMPGHPNNWSYAGFLTPDLPYSIARGRILGGSTAVNGGYFVRAPREDFELWSTVGGTAWSQAEAVELYSRSETDHQFAGCEGHGDDGPMPVERPSQNHRVTRAFGHAAKELGFLDEQDKNGNGPAGIGPLPMNVRDGVRWNTALAYLDRAGERPNLSIRGGTTVRRVLFDGTRAGAVDVDGPEGRSTVQGKTIVLCAGAIGSAHLLLLSGIGPKADLEQHGIVTVADRPGVGRDFSDHPEVSVRWRPRRGVVDHANPHAMESGLNFSSGLHRNPGTADLEILPMLKPIGYLLTGNSSSMTLGVKAALRHPRRLLESVRGIPLRRLLQDVLHQADLELLVALQSGSSRGQLTLQSADPLVQPRIDYNYLSTEKDLAGMRKAVRTAVDILSSRAFRPLLQRITEPDRGTVSDDALLDKWMRSRLGTALHMSGTAKMGPADDPGAVVDPFGRVHGVTGLRVADTSILPAAPLRGPAATAVMIGEFMAHHLAASGAEGLHADPAADKQ